MEKHLINNWANFKQTSLCCSLDVQYCLEIYIALDKSLCAKTTAFKYEYQVLLLKQLFSGERF